MSEPTSLKERLRTDLTEAIRQRNKLRSGTIRMVLSAISEAEVAGTEAVQLTEQQVLDVVIREAKKRREAEEAYAAAGRTELAEKERSESVVLAEYLPQQLSAEEISAIVATAIASTGAAELGQRGIGKVMGAVTPQTKGKADGGAGRRRGPTSAGRTRPRASDRARRSTASAQLGFALLLLALLRSLLLGLARFLLRSGDLRPDRGPWRPSSRSCRTARCTSRDPATSPAPSPSVDCCRRRRSRR